MRRLALPTVLALIAAPLVLAGVAGAQSNVVPGLDLELTGIDQIQAVTREGTFPFGTNGLAMSTTICNRGTVEVSWRQAMNPDHPMITFLVAREDGDAFEQVSDWSFVKHGFFALTLSLCDTCIPPNPNNGSMLGVGCSDTYSVNNNGDGYWLAPPGEIDPWLGEWDRFCSHFDRGEPPVAPPFDCDGFRNLTQNQVNNLGPLGHKIRVTDQEFDRPNANFFYQGYYVTEGEDEALRENNMGSRALSVVEVPNTTFVVFPSGNLQNGTILNRWSGATITSSTNGGDDGRLYVGVKVTGPVDGMWHYEYAVHNRDNGRGVGEIRIPICSGARVTNAGFHDVDGEPLSDWTTSLSPGGDAIHVTDTLGTNPLNWNSIFSFRFDSDAAPGAAPIELQQAAAGAGLPFVTVDSTAPQVLRSVYLGAGCSNGVPPSLGPGGANPLPQLGNPQFEIHSASSQPGSIAVLYYGTTGVPTSTGLCTLWTGASARRIGRTSTDGLGRAFFPAPIPNDLSLEGLEVDFQAVVVSAVGSPSFGVLELSDGLRVRVGNAVSDCP